MDHIFIASPGQLKPRWQDAFPTAQVVDAVAGTIPQSEAKRMLWLDISGDADPTERVTEAIASGAPVIVMSPVPDDNEAYKLLSLGAYGYCHTLAAPSQLKEIASVIEGGGLWVSQGVMRRLIAMANSTARPDTSEPLPEGFDTLTSKELGVAKCVAAGMNNREIAAELNVVERTVKAHLSAVFEKLNVRDRVQLALTMSRIPRH